MSVKVKASRIIKCPIELLYDSFLQSLKYRQFFIKRASILSPTSIITNEKQEKKKKRKRKNLTRMEKLAYKTCSL